MTKIDFYRSISHKKLQKQNNEDFSIQLLYAWLILTNSNFPPCSFISIEEILVQPISLDPHTTLHGKPYFFPRRPEQMVFPKENALEYDLSCIIGKDDISFSRKYYFTR